MSAILSLGTPVERMLVAAVLAPTMALVTYGTIVSFKTSATEAAIRQADAQRDFTLQYADDQKVIFKTPEGTSLLMVGSSLDWAGRIASISHDDGHWTVTTSRGLKFETEGSL